MKNVIPFKSVKEDKPENPSETFLYCKKCLNEVRNTPNTSPRDYVHLEVGVTPDSTLMVWCVRHEEMVCEVSFDGVFSNGQRCYRGEN